VKVRSPGIGARPSRTGDEAGIGDAAFTHRRRGRQAPGEMAACFR
jgi:hypothetical protein